MRLFLLFMLISSTVFCQGIKYEDLEGAKRNAEYLIYQDHTGSMIRVGDTVEIVRPESVNNYTAVLYGNNSTGFERVDRIIVNKKVIIKKFEKW